MNRVTSIALYMVLIVSPGAFAHAQPVSTPASAVETLIRCAHLDAGSPALQSCGIAQPGETIRLGSNITRQEIECILSGVCPAGESSRIS